VGFGGCSKGGDYPKMAAMVERFPAVFGIRAGVGLLDLVGALRTGIAGATGIA
jgi:hypothetical protein